MKTVGKDERSYLMAISACRDLKDWQWAYKFYKRGQAWLTYSQDMWEALKELHEGLTEEESDLFISLPRIKGKLGETSERKKRVKPEKTPKTEPESAEKETEQTAKA